MVQTNYEMETGLNNVVIDLYGYYTVGVDIDGFPLNYNVNVHVQLTINPWTGELINFERIE